MRFGSILVPWLSVALAVPAMSGDGRGVKKPRLDLRASPRMALMPVDVLVVAELVGGDAIEDFYCPAIEWDWGDGARSAHESGRAAHLRSPRSNSGPRRPQPPARTTS